MCMGVFFFVCFFVIDWVKIGMSLIVIYKLIFLLYDYVEVLIV